MQIPTSNNINPGTVIILVIVGVLLLSLYRRRQNAWHNLRYFIRAALGGAAVYLFFNSDPAFQAAAIIIAGLVVWLIYANRPGRARHIPKSVRRKKIADWQRKTGKRFNRRKQELDHIVPFSKGGSHTADNLRVAEKVENRAKGAKSPWWDIFGWWQ